MKNRNSVLVIVMVTWSGCAMFKPAAPTRPDQVDAKMGYLTHEVVKGETPKCLAKKYKISIEEVFTLNPDLDKAKPKQKLTPGSSVKLLNLPKK